MIHIKGIIIEDGAISPTYIHISSRECVHGKVRVREYSINYTVSENNAVVDDHETWYSLGFLMSQFKISQLHGCLSISHNTTVQFLDVLMHTLYTVQVHIYTHTVELNIWAIGSWYMYIVHAHRLLYMYLLLCIRSCRRECQMPSQRGQQSVQTSGKCAGCGRT